MSNIIEHPPESKLDEYFLKFPPRDDLIDLMSTPPQSVLELGCGIGQTGKAIAQKYNSQITGIDINPEAIEVAKQHNCYDQLISCDLDQTPIPPQIQHLRFDYILYPDVLEHLKNPWQIVKLHLQLLKPEGVILASIPNIRHISIFRKLFLQGTWPYEETGILDRTHLRFFTKREMINLFEQAALQVNYIKPKSLYGLPLLKKINRLTSNSLEEFLTIQYLIKASRP